MSKVFLIAGLMTISCFNFGQDSELNKDQEYLIQYIDVRAGLSNNYVSQIIEDDLGIKWLATEGGINKYEGDGYVTVYKPGTKYPNFPNENVETIFKASDGNLWIGTMSGGLAEFNTKEDQLNESNYLLGLSDQHSDLRITSIEENDQNQLWVGTWSHGLFVIDAALKKPVRHFLDSTLISDIIQDEFGNIWASSVNFIHKYDPSEDRLISLELPIGLTYEIIKDPDQDKIYIASHLGIFELNTLTYKFKELEASVTGGFKGISCLMLDEQKRLWAGSWTEGLRRSDTSLSSFEYISLLPKEQNYTTNKYDLIRDIYQEENGLIWVCTGYGGVLKLSKKEDFHFIGNTSTVSSGLEDDNTVALEIDGQGRLWAGSWGGSLSYSQDWNTFKRLNKIKLVQSLLALENELIVGTRRGLWSIDLGEVEEPAALLNDSLQRIRSLYFDSYGILWVGTQEQGLLKVDYRDDPNLQKIKFFGKSQFDSRGIESDRISDITEDKEGNVWVCTYNGLYKYDRQEDRFIRFDQPQNGKATFPSVIFLSMHSASDGTLWVGMSGGVLQFKLVEDKLVRLNKLDIAHGLANEYVLGVTSDAANNLWVSTALGISKIQAPDHIVTNFDSKTLGLSAMNANAFAQDKKHLAFGGTSGMVYFNPNKIDVRNKPPEVVLSRLTVDNKLVAAKEKINDQILLKESIHYAKEVALTHQEKVISLKVIPTDYLGVENIHYYYRLLGVNDDWIHNKNNNEVSIIGLNPGTYTLQVRASRNNLDYGAIRSLTITKSRPPWLSNWAIVLYAAFLAFLIGLGRKVFLKQQSLKTEYERLKISNEKEHELAEAKISFFTNMSHELRTPLTLISAPVTEMLARKDLSVLIREKLLTVERNASKLLHLVNQLLDFRKAENGMLSLRTAKGDIVKFVREIFLSFKSLAEAKKIDFNLNTSPQTIYCEFDRDKMEIVICNLLSNAFKYVVDQGKIAIDISLTECGEVSIEVTDTGQGMDQMHLSQIFDRFYQIKGIESANLAGSGIGLYLAKSIVELHGGDIEVESQEGVGSIFTVVLPLSSHLLDDRHKLKDFKGSDDIDSYEHHPASAVDVNNEELAHSKEETILIVDDHQEIRKYLHSILSEDYNVLEAKDGKVAMEISTQHLPDLIISDIMMPEMDGIELTKALKSELLTSHIPIILLTARTSTVFELDGLETGADDYIRKPFNPMTILARIHGILENRRKLGEYLRNRIRFEPDDTIAENIEEKFVQKAVALVNEHLNNSELDAPVMADLMHMSQSSLYRKLKALSGMSITAFIRSVRLKKAAEYMMTEDMSLAQVGYEVGFNDYKYFQKCFKEQYGCPPSDYRKEKLKKVEKGVVRPKKTRQNTTI
ncbi:MAG: two-component regulator propeller domain-containing protein [Bacteroidota bacterium]